MTIQEDFEFQQVQAFFEGGSRNSGMLVTTKTGLIGRTYTHEDTIYGKVIVHTEKGKLLCTPETLLTNGFID